MDGAVISSFVIVAVIVMIVVVVVVIVAAAAAAAIDERLLASRCPASLGILAVASTLCWPYLPAVFQLVGLLRTGWMGTGQMSSPKQRISYHTMEPNLLAVSLYCLLNH